MAYRLPNGTKVLNLNSEISIGIGEFKIEPGQVCYALEARCAAKVNATGSHAALTTTMRDALLKALQVDFSHGGDADGERTQMLQNSNLLEMRQDAEKLSEYVIAGYTDSTTGLATALANGQNTLSFVGLIPMGEVQDIDELRRFGGMGYDQLLTAKLTMKLGSDPLTPLDALLALVNPGAVTIEFWPRTRPVNGSQWGEPPVRRSISEASKLEAAFGDGLPVHVTEDTNPSASQATNELRVKIGDERVHDFPASFTDVLNEYLRDPSVTGTRDTSEYHGILYSFGKTPIKKVRTGSVAIAQRTQVLNPLKLTYRGYQVLDVARVFRYVQLVAAKKTAGTVIKAISIAALDSIDVDPGGRQLPFLPWRLFTDDEVQFHTFSGLRCVQGEQPTVHIPTHALDAAVIKYATELQRPDGATRAEQVIRELSMPIPGAVISGRGFAGGESLVYKEVKRQVLARWAAMSEAAKAA
jgi:hypothetical protein